MIRIKIERRPESAKLGWSEIKEGLGDACLLVLALCFLFLSVLLVTSDGIIITSFSRPLAVVTVVVAVALVALGVERLVRGSREK
jgi:small neutral amino acid transporter SnatA (MarC family)